MNWELAYLVDLCVAWGALFFIIGAVIIALADDPYWPFEDPCAEIFRREAKAAFKAGESIRNLREMVNYLDASTRAILMKAVEAPMEDSLDGYGKGLCEELFKLQWAKEQAAQRIPQWPYWLRQRNHDLRVEPVMPKEYDMRTRDGAPAPVSNTIVEVHGKTITWEKWTRMTDRERQELIERGVYIDAADDTIAGDDADRDMGLPIGKKT